jgi:hypothetical protein
MKIEELDAFAIKRYSFALGKTNSYFTCSTVILSILILAASVYLNYATVSHLWIPSS